MYVCINIQNINIQAHTEGRAARVIMLQQHVRKGSSQAVHEFCPASRTPVPVTALSNSRERFTPHHVDLQPSAGPPSHPKTIMCHCKTHSAPPFNKYVLFLKDSLQKLVPPVVTILPLFPSPNGQSMLRLVPTLSFK